MKGKLDISQLYERKFLTNTPPKLAFSSPFTFNQQILHNYGQFSQRIRPLNQKTSIKYVRITKKNNGSQVIKQSGHSLYFRDQRIQSIERKKQVHPSQQRKSELLRQMMKLSRQQLGDLQISMGGENKLLKTFKCFFQRRNKIRQQEKTKMTKIDFRPVRSNIQRYSNRSNSSRDKQKNRQSDLLARVDKQVEKELAPWQSVQIQVQ